MVVMFYLTNMHLLWVYYGIIMGQNWPAPHCEGIKSE